MYIPLDPKSINGMWGELLNSLSSHKSCLVVCDGKLNDGLETQILSRRESEILLDKLKARDYVRIGSSHMTPMPAHFSINFSDGPGRLMELISLSSDESRLKNDLLMICQFFFFENNKVNELMFPFVVQGISDPDFDFKINGADGVTRVFKKESA